MSPCEDKHSRKVSEASWARKGFSMGEEMQPEVRPMASSGCLPEDYVRDKGSRGKKNMLTFQEN